MKKTSTTTKGFSLLEIMVVVAIMAIMASTVVVSFGAFEKTVRVRETAGVITDTIKNLELEMIRRDYIGQTIHFEKDYLVSEAEAENQTTSFSLKRADTGACGDKDELEANNSLTSPVYLAQRDAEGNNLNISVIPASSATPVCVAFLDSKETEWDYQLFQGSAVSQTIRFLHFNVRRGDSPSNRVSIVDNDFTLQITAPYGTKEFYDGSAPTTDEVKLTVENADKDSKEEIILQS